MLNLSSCFMLLATMAGAANAVGADRFELKVVNPDDNTPVADQRLVVSPEGDDSRIWRTDAKGTLVLPKSLLGKDAAITCSKAPRPFDRRQTLEADMRYKLELPCREDCPWTGCP